MIAEHLRHLTISGKIDGKIHENHLPGLRGVAPTKVVGVSEHRAGVVARGVLYPAGVGRSGVESALAVPSNVASSGCVARKAPVEMGSGVAGGKLGSSP